MNDPKPPKPADEPDTLKPCNVCAARKPKIESNFEIYWSHNRWYWRPECSSCRKLRGQMKVGKRAEQVEKHINDLIAEGQQLSSREIMRRMELSDDRTIRKIWDWLSARGRVPERPQSEAERPFSPGQLDHSQIGQEILKLQVRFRRMSEVLANDDSKEVARRHWLEQWKILLDIGFEVEEQLSDQTWDIFLARMTEKGNE